MSETWIDIDDEALEDAMRLARVKAQDDMVNLALREYVERCRRTEARLRHLQITRGRGEAMASRPSEA
ncbi:hypothetical protein SRB5_42870 [Streptomyces sp. RB5]|uniref:Type II toxin-antitoxin system VapB family antitoxin n=1 Tax=Streptomyces smaragdinus TaxID=2585196 RepID=A0A7K0CKU3_9ACTN|nr:type II toxin-antitoxin system VapB family antitoxin [Streptomyces smaragdinus]MQY14125.1 hypothetical protein [Streptomyces smaragdinus]